ncbi:MAG: RhuM family protein, partial [Candidatus Cloacimonetes bacterium]|nr:RhuM family protein [Candidatus Cloacimonadota bacterium]
MKDNQIIIYQTEDGQTKIDVTVEKETVWLTQSQMAELFQRDTSVISRHIKNIFEEGELDEKSNLHFLQIANSDKPVAFYSLDVIISVGYRVKSLRGTQFRIWANKVLKEYMIKGFAMNDDLLKDPTSNYFDELLKRVRDIRSSEKMFYRKVLDIYALSIDYNPKSDESKTFFATVQNKMHFAASGKTAAELIYERADSKKDFMGLTSWKGYMPQKNDALVAK